MTVPTPRRPGGPVQVAGKIIAVRRVGAYQHLTILAPGVAETARPGQFVALAVGGERTGMLLRRSFSIHKVSPTGVYGGTVDVVVADAGRGTHWLTTRDVGEPVDVVGPLGRAFPLPKTPQSCVLVGGGYGTAPLFWLADVLRERGCRVDIVLGAASQDRLFGVLEARRSATTSTVTTDDGSAGTKGRVTDVLGEVIDRADAAVVYACGPMAMLRAVTDVAALHGAVAQVAVEESMACGVGICMTCVMPVEGSDGVTRMLRSCVEGPVFRGDTVRWETWQDGIGRVPDDCVGAAAMRSH
ncbi:dihydroorotate dehydrogenase electron transfer subunit [Angustibacter sp. McL0619]|uniref:dihydroorotate dehydrogenase electron transfer subunit n=1 Tax=Angustibacter sp. McL0619 TaxID=3415676 RepID=UPI003CEF4233